MFRHVLWQLRVHWVALEEHVLDALQKPLASEREEPARRRQAVSNTVLTGERVPAVGLADIHDAVVQHICTGRAAGRRREASTFPALHRRTVHKVQGTLGELSSASLVLAGPWLVVQRSLKFPTPICRMDTPLCKFVRICSGTPSAGLLHRSDRFR